MHKIVGVQHRKIVIDIPDSTMSLINEYLKENNISFEQFCLKECNAIIKVGVQHLFEGVQHQGKGE